MRLKPITVSLLCLFTAIAVFAGGKPTKLLRQPSISADNIAFIYAGDVWTADRGGANPRRLTIHQGSEMFPHLSPDGKLIAFTGDYDGNVDVFVVPIEGGSPRRLTFHPDADIVEGWSPDGKSILFRSNRNNHTYRYKRLYTVSLEGGLPEVLPIPSAEHGCFSPDASKVAYTPLRDAFTTWKHYRGGRTAKIWLFDMATSDVVLIPRDNSNDTQPVWLGDKVYFLSDRNWTMNIFSYDPANNEVMQVTNHDDFDVKYISAGDGMLIYEQAGVLHTYDPRTSVSEVVNIHINPDLPDTRPSFVDCSDNIQDFNISPTGKRALFEARGEIFTVPLEKGDTRNLTNTPGAAERNPVWSPDGSKIAYFSDESGDYKLHIIDQKGLEKAVEYPLGESAFFFNPEWSPDGKRILFVNHEASLFYLDLDSKKVIKADQNETNSPWMSVSWSPDSKWISYIKRIVNGYHTVFVYNIDSKRISQLTDGMSDAQSPAWSRDGKYLYFSASTNWGLHNNALEMSEFERPIRRSLYLAVLSKDTENPFAPQSDEEETKMDDDKNKKKDKKKDIKKKDDDDEEEELKVVIDFDNIDQRILSLPLPERDYLDLQCSEEGMVFYLEDVENEDTHIIHRFDLKKREGEEYLSGVSAFTISADGKKLLYQGEGKKYGIVECSGSPKIGDGKIDVSGMKSYKVPNLEWEQMFRETYRIEKHLFYDRNMHGADWEGVYEKYKPFLKSVGHRSDLTYLQGEMLGELVVGHAYVWDGDVPKVEKVKVGMLGADFTVENGFYKFDRIYSGLNWNPKLRAPLTEPGVDVREGDYLLEVGGIKLTGEMNVYSLFQNTADKQIVIKVNSKADLKGARTVTVVPVSDDRSLRYRAWVEHNREYVDKATGGRVAYVYMPNTSWAGYNSFNRYYFAQLDKEAVILDERWNGGGKTADYVIDLLDRPLMNWWVTRTGRPWSTPGASIYGPKVMIINESAGSGGDAMPAYFRRSGLGKLVGMRTWGGLVGISYRIPLMDGGGVTSPSFGILSPDGEWEIENHGVDPDIEVDMTPKMVIEGRDPQLEKAIEVILEELEANPVPKPIIPEKPVRARKQ